MHLCVFGILHCIELQIKLAFLTSFVILVLYSFGCTPLILTHQQTLDKIFNTLFDDKGETSYACKLGSEQWVDEALKMIDFMSATDHNLAKFQRLLDHVDWNDAEPLGKIKTLLWRMGRLNIVGHCAPYSNISDTVLEEVFSAALHHSYADDVAVLWSKHSWTPTVGVARDFMAHLVYNNFPPEDDFQKTFQLFLQRCDAETVIGAFEQYGKSFLDPEDNNWEPSFVSSDIDQWSEQWSLEQQKRLQSLVEPRVLFPQLCTRVQKDILQKSIEDVKHSHIQRSSVRRL